MIDALASEYKWSLDSIMEDTPLCTAFALYRAILARYDQDTGPTFEQEEFLRENTSLRKDLRALVRQMQHKGGGIKQ